MMEDLVNIIAFAFLFLAVGTLVLIFRDAFAHLSGDDQITFRRWIGRKLNLRIGAVNSIWITHVRDFPKSRKRLLFVLFLLSFVTTAVGYQLWRVAGRDNQQQHSKTINNQDKSPVSASPFLLAVAADRAGITMAHSSPRDSDLPRRDFYVVISNISKQPQTVWEDWNSWGYKAFSFELTTEDGKKYVVSKRQQDFTVNFPSTLLIEPGEFHVFTIHLDEWWETHPSLPKTAELPISLKAIYEIFPTPESAQYKVWTGRVESHIYKFTLKQ